MGAEPKNPDYLDELGMYSPLPAHHGQRIIPADDFPTGPEIGTRLPDFTLTNARGETVAFHEHRGDSKAAVFFNRSVVW
ncbi:MAG: hypothetical protein ACI8TP_002091 [Acidimicrobiales bacterium]|jgi:hypothetical protein